MKLEETESAVIVQPGSAPRAAVIWLHGLGADGYDFVPIVPELRVPPDAAVRFVFPHAPVRPVTLNQGMAMRAWYDIKSLDRNGIVDEPGIRESMGTVRGWIDRQVADGIPANRIVIAGFSQGGAIAQTTALRHAARLAGLVALSTYLPLSESLAKEGTAVNKALPILMAHGTYDPMLPLAIGEWSRDRLREFGYTVDWHAYPMAHEVCAEEIEVIGAFLRHVLGG